MAATIWKGVIAFGDVSVPVRFLSAVQDRSIRFHLLHAKDHARVKQSMVNPETGEIVPQEQIQRGYQADESTYVVFDKAELEQLQPSDSRSITIESFVPRAQISHQWYERPYYLGPDGRDGDYAALAAALADSGLEGVARWVMRKRQYLGSLQALDGHLMMVTLRHADEVVLAGSLPAPEGRALNAKELKLAEQLIGALHTDFDPTRYRDEYRERVMAFIEAKAKGRQPRLRLVKPSKAREPQDLAAILSRSVKAASKGRKSA